ncbi:MAG: site-specific integrase [Tepidisphaeraceae bacterium]
MKISYHAGKQLYRKTIGKYQKADGTTSPRDFWLGNDQVKATVTAQTLVEFWKMFLVPRNEPWTEMSEKQAFALVRMKIGMAQGGVTAAAQRYQDLMGSPPPARATPTPVTPSPNARTLRSAAEAFANKMRARRLSISHVSRFEAVFKQVYEVLPEETPLDQLDEAKLVAVVSHFTGRPTSKLTGKPLAVDSIKRVFQYTKALLDDMDGDAWKGPRRWQKLFKVRWASLMTPAEQKKQAQGKDTFTDNELKELYALASDRTRMLMLLGLNCALPQKEIATLQLDDIDLKDGVIDRIRHKTRGTAAVRTRWVLWPETLKLVKAHLVPANEHGLAFMSEQGQPLVNNAARTDSIALAWARLLAHAEKKEKKVRPFSFGTLRKTSSTAVLRISGSELLQQQHLAHRTQTVAGKHYTGTMDFAALNDALARYRLELIKAGVLPIKAAKEPILVPAA